MRPTSCWSRTSAEDSIPIGKGTTLGHYRIVDLLDQDRYPSTVSCPTTGQIRGDDLTCIGIDSEVQLSPSPAFRGSLQMTDVDPETRAVDEQMDRSIRREPAVPDLAELLEPSGQRRMVGNRDLQLVHVGQGTKEALGLPEWKMEDHADRQGCLNRDVCLASISTRDHELTRCPFLA